MVELWFSFGSVCCGLSLYGSAVVQLWLSLLCPDDLWFSCGPALVQLWFSWLSPDGFWLNFGSDVVDLSVWHDCAWLSVGSALVQLYVA